MILSNQLLNICVYSHRFVLLPTFVKGSCSVLRGNGEYRNTFPWLFKVLRISNCEYSTSHGASLSPPFPSLPKAQGTLSEKMEDLEDKKKFYKMLLSLDTTWLLHTRTRRSGDCLRITGTISSQVKISLGKGLPSYWLLGEKNSLDFCFILICFQECGHW